MAVEFRIDAMGIPILARFPSVSACGNLAYRLATER
jgi:hypothetical protein